MEKLEYIESKLSELTSEFKKSIILGEDGKEYTFEDYLHGYVLNTMRDDFTFGCDEIVDNLDTLIMLHSHNTGLDPIEKIELPKINKARISDVIYDYIKEKGYQKYLNCFMDYNNELFGTLETMIQEFLVPYIDDRGNITEFGITYPFREFIDLKVKNYLEKIEEEKNSKKEFKRKELKEKYREYLNYPTNDIDHSITTFGLYIDELLNMMDDDGYVDINVRMKIDKVLDAEIVKCIKKYNDMQHVCKLVNNAGKGTLEDFKRFALVTNAQVPEGTIIDELLQGILSNIKSKINVEQIDSLCKEIIDMNIKNKGIQNRALQTLMGIAVDKSSNFTESENIMVVFKKEKLESIIKEYESTEEFTIETAKSFYDEFSKLLDELIELLKTSELFEDNRGFILKMEEYQTSMKTRYKYEDEKNSIVSTYRRLKSQMDDDDVAKLNDYYFSLNSVIEKAKDLLEIAAKNIRINNKDKELFENMEATLKELKKLLIEQDDKRVPKY